jgi:condensin complex subunit 3
MPAPTPKTPPASFLTDQLPDLLPQIFQQSQLTLANHRKNIVSLRKLQQSCAQITTSSKDGKSLKLVGEKAFNEQMINMVNRVLGIKKGVVQADRVVKFVASYVAYCTEQGEPHAVPIDR